MDALLKRAEQDCRWQFVSNRSVLRSAISIVHPGILQEGLQYANVSAIRQCRLGRVLMRIVVVGTGYVGLVSGACLADFGHQVTCVDKDATKINSLTRGEIA